MNINKKLPLFLRDVYSYDIVSCHYTILENLGTDLSDIPIDSKKERNIKIGLLMQKNPRMTHILRSVTNSTLSEYITRNHLKEEEIIIRQYDGIITTRPLTETTDRYIPLELRSIYQNMIISVDRDMYIAFDGMKSIVKGVPHLYEGMENIYDKICKINFMSKNAIFSSMQRIKDEILTSEDASLYAIPSTDDKSIIYLKRYGDTQISNTMVRIMDTDDIDKIKYFEYYIKPFFKSIVKEFV